jgi:hypothetical protein
MNPSHFSEITNRSLNFFHPYFFNCNSESGDSCAKILRIISSFSSIYSYACDCCIYVIVCLSIKRIIPEPMYEDFQEQVYEDFKMKYTRTLIFSFQSNEVSVLEHITPTYFSVYSIKLEFHVGSVCSTYLCYGLTRIDLSFLENLRSIV